MSDTSPDALAGLRDKYRAYAQLNGEAAILTAKAQQALAGYNLAFTEELVRRKVQPGSTIDLNDGNVKPAADARPWTPE